MNTMRSRIRQSADNITSALTVGTTLPTRLWLSIGMILYSAGFFANQGTWLSSPSFATMNDLVKIQHWGIAYGIGGLAMFWRVLDLKSNVYCAWIINVYVLLIWMSSVIIRFWGIGSASLGSVHTAYFLAALWILLRTEATPRDKETS